MLCRALQVSAAAGLSRVGRLVRPRPCAVCSPFWHAYHNSECSITRSYATLLLVKRVGFLDLYCTVLYSSVDLAGVPAWSIHFTLSHDPSTYTRSPSAACHAACHCFTAHYHLCIDTLSLNLRRVIDVHSFDSGKPSLSTRTAKRSPQDRAVDPEFLPATVTPTVVGTCATVVTPCHSNQPFLQLVARHRVDPVAGWSSCSCYGLKGRTLVHSLALVAGDPHSDSHSSKAISPHPICLVKHTPRGLVQDGLLWPTARQAS